MDRHTRALEILACGTVIPATPLALDDNGNFDENGQRLLMRYYLDSGVGGIATAVHTTQFEIRLPEYNLYDKILNIVKQEIDAYEKKTGRVIVRVAGACGKTEQAVSEAEKAKALGYDAILLSPGSLNDMTEQYMLERTRAVARVMPVIGFYLQERVGGRVFTYDYWSKLCELENVVAIKAAPFNRYGTLDVVRAASMSSRKDKIALYTGNDDNIVVDLLTNYEFTRDDGTKVVNGFVGGLLGHWTLWSASVVEMYGMLMQAKKQQKIDASLLTLAARVTDCNAAFFDPANKFAGCIPGVHEVLCRQGLMKSTRCLNPEEKLSEGQSEEITRIYNAYPGLNDDDFVKANIDKWRK